MKKLVVCLLLTTVVSSSLLHGTFSPDTSNDAATACEEQRKEFKKVLDYRWPYLSADEKREWNTLTSGEQISLLVEYSLDGMRQWLRNRVDQKKHQEFLDEQQAGFDSFESEKRRKQIKADHRYAQFVDLKQRIWDFLFGR